MNKMNKKGFTLIEMLVVIAIIAVLVAIIIPTVSSATDKAAAATNAANLRSWKSELTTAVMMGEITKPANSVTDGTFASGNTTHPAPKSKAVGGLAADQTAKANYDVNTNQITVTFGAGNTIDAFAKVASGAKASTIVAYS